MKSTIAFVFPGQGSQSIGMLSDLAGRNSSIQHTFQEVSDFLGYDVWRLTQDGPLEQLNTTEFTQVAMLTADIAVYRVLKSCVSITPALMAGHSLGEYAALVAAEVLPLSEAAALVACRGRLMQETIPLGQGAMAAIVGLTDAQIETVCQEVSLEHEQVAPANYNAIGQVVIAGHKSAVERAIAQALKLDARLAMILPVSVPCHCTLLTEASKQFAEQLEKTVFQAPVTSVISNVDLSIYQNPTQMRTLLAQQLYRPVRWVETIQYMKQQGIDSIIECGPGRVLSGLVKRIDRSISAYPVDSLATLDAVRTDGKLGF